MKILTRPIFLAILFLIILAIPALKSLTIPNFYTSHDGETHTARIAQYYLALKDGQIPPRLAPTLYNGLGSPIFVYIYPLPYMLGSLIHQIGFSYVDSFKAVMALSFIASGLFSYLWLKEVMHSQKAAFLGALYYVWIPYRFSLIYVRASISEMLAYTFLPLTLFCITKLAIHKNLTWAALTSVSVAAVLLSQNLVALITLPIIVTYLIIQSLFSKSFKTFTIGVLSLAWAFMISSFTYLPALFERNYTRFDDTLKNAYLDHFVTLKQLIRSPWDYGFDLKATVNDQMSFQIGLAHILVTLITILIVTFFVVVRKRFNKELVLVVFFLILFLVSNVLMLQTNFTIELWNKFKFLQIIDLPWRFLGLVAVSTSFFAAYIVKNIRPGIVLLFLVIAVLIANRNHLRINQTVVHDDHYFETYTNTATQYSEFTTRWRQSTGDPIGYDLNSRVEVTDGEAQITNVNVKSNKVEFDANVTTPKSQIRINKFYFPKTLLYVDGHKLPEEEIIITGSTNSTLNTRKDTSGLVAINLKSGNHTVSLRYQETKLRVFANVVSLISIIIALGIIIKNVKR